MTLLLLVLLAALFIGLRAGLHLRALARLTALRIEAERVAHTARIAERAWPREVEQDDAAARVYDLREELHVAEARWLAVDPDGAGRAGVARMRAVGR